MFSIFPVGVIMQNAFEYKGKIGIKFSFPDSREDFYNILLKVKSLPGRKYIGSSRMWTVPISLYAINLLSKWGFELDPLLSSMNKKAIPGGDKLYPFQKEGILFIEDKRGRAIVGDEMGLGKSVQALMWLKTHPEIRPAIIICPAPLKLMWEKEIKKWGMKDLIYILNGRKLHKIPIVDIYIINYDIVANLTKKEKKKKIEIKNTGWISMLHKIEPKALIFDECHKLANDDAARTKACIEIGRETEHIIGLSGTPFTSRPIQFWNVLNLIRPDIFKNRFWFGKNYCDGKYNGFGWEFNGASNLDQLHDLLVNNIMIRRLKKDVMKELPEKQRTAVPIEINNRKEYDYASDNFLQWILETEGKEKAEKASKAEGLVRKEKLKQLSIEGKIKDCIKWISDFLESGEKIVLFCIHTKTIDTIMKKFGKIAVKLDGRDSNKTQQEAVEKFQTDDEIKIFIGNDAAAEGHTLTAASNVGFLEFDWTPGKLNQKEDRVHRIGQKSNSVNIYYFVATNTVEERILELLDDKKKIFDTTIDGVETDEDKLLMKLLEEEYEI
jgi:SWI/SNF-related matrix-associated actin-dependent regulator 1 of chromatin subfamily A